jgi:type IV pilus assembly protein PilM
MLNSSYNAFFPIPDFLSLPAFGLDISDESLKYMELKVTKNGIKVGRHGEKKIPPGVIEAGKILDQKKMEEILSLLRKEEGIKSVRVSLPEEQIYLFKLRLDKLGLESVREGIELSIEDHIPIPAKDAIFDYGLIDENEKDIQLQVVAIPKNVIENYLAVFENSSISVQSFELEAQAIARAVVKKEDMGTYMIVDFGEKRTGISIISRGIAMFTSTIDVGGVILTNTIKKNFKITTEEADKMKKEYGLQRNVGNKEIFSVLLNSVSVLRDEIAKHFLYWHTHKDEEGKDNPPIKKILLCGGDSNLIGLSEYFAVSMKTSVEMANVWTSIVDTQESVPDISFKRALSFAAALGLALGNFDHD